MDVAPQSVDVSPVCHPFAVEAVAQAAQRHEIPRPVGIRLDLLPQIRHLVVDDAIGHVRVAAPDLVEQLRAREQAAGALDERRQQLEFERREVDRLAAAPELAAGEIELRVAEPVDVAQPVARCGANAP